MRGARRAVVAATAAACTVAACSTRPGTGPQAGTTHAPGTRTSTHAATGSLPEAPHHRARAVTAHVLPWRLPHRVSREVAMPYVGGVLLAGGLGQGDVSTARVLAVDLRTGSVRAQRPLAKPVHDSAGAVLSGRPTVFGGGGATELDDVQQRDPQGRWRVVGRLPQARSDLSVATAGARRAVVIGGYDGRQTPTAVLVTEDGSHFSREARLPSGVRYAGVGSSRGHLWVLGGEVDGHELSEVLEVDLGTGRIRLVGRLPRPLGHEAVAFVGDRLLVAGGRTSPTTVTSQMWWYQPARGTWTRAGRLPYPLADAAAVSVGGSLYLLGGETPGFTARVIRIR